VLTFDLHLDNPVYLIMSSPVVYIRDNNSVFDAINICHSNSINHPVVRNEVDKITGILRIDDIYRLLKDSLSFFIKDVRKSESKEELKQHYKKLQRLIKPLIKSDIFVKYITNITSAFSDAVTKRIIELTISEIGNPPADFSFINLGSEGRKEETLFTDQDNAIIYEDASKGNESSVNDYFNTLGERVCDSLNYTGYSFCKGNIMAKNQQWCQPFSVWEKYFAGWITTPEPKNLMDATIFFDFRSIYGDEEITCRLRNTINSLINKHSLFLYHLAHNTANLKPTHISSGNIISDKNADLIDLKNAVQPLIMFVRTYSLQNKVLCTNTLDRLNELKAKHIISANTADEITFAYNYLMKLRLKNQIELSDNNQPMSNRFNSKKLIDFELAILKKVLSLIPSYQNKIIIDFRIST
jgi:CBS domain-containing protein